MRTSYSLNQDQFQAFRFYWEGETNTISPFHTLQRVGITEIQKKQFEENGLLDNEAQKTKDMEDILKILAMPAIRYIMRYTDNKSNFKLDIYQRSETGEKCVIFSMQDSRTIFYPCNTGEVSNLIRNTAVALDLLSSGVPVALSLSRVDAAVMGVLIDIQRQSLFNQEKEGKIAEGMRPITSTAYEVFEVLHNYEKNPQNWPIITLFFEEIPFGKIKDGDVRESLSRIFAQGYLSRSGDGYVLVPALLPLSKTLVNPSFILLISAMALTEGHPAREIKQNILGGPDVIFRISSQSADEGIITMDTVISESVSNLIRQMINDPSRQFGDMPPDKTRGAGSTKIPVQVPINVCPQCGNPLSESANFCRKCGTSIQRTSEGTSVPISQCPQCGNPVNKGAKFCRKCGKNL